MPFSTNLLKFFGMKYTLLTGPCAYLLDDVRFRDASLASVAAAAALCLWGCCERLILGATPASLHLQCLSRGVAGAFNASVQCIAADVRAQGPSACLERVQRLL